MGPHDARAVKGEAKASNEMPKGRASTNFLQWYWKHWNWLDTITVYALVAAGIVYAVEKLFR